MTTQLTLVPKRKIFVAGPAGSYINWMDGEIEPDITKADVVCFTGGTDVNSALYGKKPNRYNDHPDNDRDTAEKEIFNMAFTLQKPMIGICRGAQFLCVMSGGILVQHQKHAARHYINTWDGRSILVTSDHHQRAYPYQMQGGEFRILGTCKDMSPFNEGEDAADDMTDEVEVENCYYRRTTALGIQSHPEWMFPATDQETHDSIMHHRALLKQLIAGVL